MAAPSEPSLGYNNFYHTEYSTQVDAYPYHMVMFSH